MFDPNALGGLMGGLGARMNAMREEAARAEVEGQAGGGLVIVVANGALEVVRVTISERAAADRELLEDLVQVATNDALRKARDLLAQKMSALMGGLPIPPGMLGI